MAKMMDGLIIRSPWIDMILSGTKTWEIRGSATKKRGWISLIKSGTQKIFGICELIDVKGPLSILEYRRNEDKHGISVCDLVFEDLPYDRTYAWVLQNPIALDHPVGYVHPYGAVIWVKVPLTEEFERAIESADESYTS